jgi:hypothetical protein
MCLDLLLLKESKGERDLMNLINDLAKKYPAGVTEEKTKDGNTNITKRIVVIGNKGYLYEKKETSFGATYYFKDGVAINQQQFDKDTQKK